MPPSTPLPSYPHLPRQLFISTGISRLFSQLHVTPHVFSCAPKPVRVLTICVRGVQQQHVGMAVLW